MITNEDTVYLFLNHSQDILKKRKTRLTNYTGHGQHSARDVASVRAFVQLSFASLFCKRVSGAWDVCLSCQECYRLFGRFCQFGYVLLFCIYLFPVGTTFYIPHWSVLVF